MIYKMFSVFDNAAKAFYPPFYQRSTAEAIRSFSDSVRDTKHVFCAHPEDYTLFEVGAFDDSNCQLVGLDPPHRVMLAVEVVQQQ